jgi:hypothetical protein
MVDDINSIPCSLILHASVFLFQSGMMMNVGFINNGINVKTVHKNNNNACVRDMQIEHLVNALGQTVLSSLIGGDKSRIWMVK